MNPDNLKSGWPYLLYMNNSVMLVRYSESATGYSNRVTYHFGDYFNKFSVGVWLFSDGVRNQVYPIDRCFLKYICLFSEHEVAHE